jgi:hypothetical protein
MARTTPSARPAALAGVALAAALALAGCTPGTGTPSSEGANGTGSPSASAETTPSATPKPAPAFALPANCSAIASTATLTTLFADIPSREPGDLTRPAPASAAKKLTCSWFTGDTTGGDVIYYSTTAPAAQAYLTVMTANGFTCTAALGGTRCDKTTANTEYEVNTIETTFTRDGVWIYISMTNVDDAPLLPDMVATAWAA